MKRINVNIIRTNDWSGVYIDNKLVLEGHSVNYNELFQDFIVGNIIDSFTNNYIDNDLEEFGCNMPENYEDIKKYVI